MEGEDSALTLKVITLGPPAAGKTCIILKAVFTDMQLPEHYTCTLGVDLKVKTMEHQGRVIKFHIWDTAGQERFLQINRMYYRGAQGVVFVFDVADRGSFEKVRLFWDDFTAHEGNAPVAKVLVGNKIDLQRQVTSREGAQLAERLRIPYIETSARSGHNVQLIFKKLLETLPAVPQKPSSALKIRRHAEKDSTCDC